VFLVTTVSAAVMTHRGVFGWPRTTVPAFLLVATVASLLVMPVQVQDTTAYIGIYESTPSIQDLLEYEFRLVGVGNNYGEFLFNYVISLFRSIDLSFNCFRFVVCVFIVYLKLFVFRALSPSFMVAVVTYFALFFSIDSSLIRQGIASSLIAVAMVAILEGRRLRLAVIAFVCAIGFHLSAITALPLFFLNRLRISNRLALSLLILFFLLGFAGGFGHFFSAQVTSIADGGYIAGKLSRGLLEVVQVGVFRGSTLGVLFLTVVYICLHRRLEKRFVYYEQIKIVALYAMSFLMVFSDVQTLSDRLYGMFAFIFPVMSAMVFTLLDRKSSGRNAVLLLFVAIIASLFLNRKFVVLWVGF